MATVKAAATPTVWRCPDCNRPFRKTGQQHSCRTVALEEHLPADHLMRPLFDHLLERLEGEVATCEIVALPCCIHLFGTYDFLAVLPRKDHLELHFALHRELNNPRVSRSTRMSATSYLHSVNVATTRDVDDELQGWLREAYQGRT